MLNYLKYHFCLSQDMVGLRSGMKGQAYVVLKELLGGVFLFFLKFDPGLFDPARTPFLVS